MANHDFEDMPEPELVHCWKCATTFERGMIFFDCDESAIRAKESLTLSVAPEPKPPLS